MKWLFNYVIYHLRYTQMPSLRAMKLGVKQDAFWSERASGLGDPGAPYTLTKIPWTDATHLNALVCILTIWSPDLSKAINAVEIAAMPDENNNVPCPPSKLLSVWLAASEVGLTQRVYNQPRCGKKHWKGSILSPF